MTSSNLPPVTGPGNDGRVLVIGDIHACPTELACMLSALTLRPDDHLICLGDYIDRGPDARAVVELLIGLRAASVCRCTFLKGNHEDMFLGFLGYGGLYGDAFLKNGGRQTLSSYGCDLSSTPRPVEDWLSAAHREFFLALESCLPIHLPVRRGQFAAGADGSDAADHFVREDFLCVHAGIRPGVDLAAQTPEDLLWIREDFFAHPHDLSYTVIYGHTPFREVDFDLPFKIGIDTGLVYGGKLSCLDLTERTLFQIRHGSRSVEKIDMSTRWPPPASTG